MFAINFLQSHGLIETTTLEYPGDFGSEPRWGDRPMESCGEAMRLYQRRIELWKNYETDEPEDEIIYIIEKYDVNETPCDSPKEIIYNVSDAVVSTIQALFKGKKARKEVAHLHRKDNCLKEATERVLMRRANTKALENRILELEKENAELKCVVPTKTPGFLDKVKFEVEELLHIRQIHHLRKTKLIPH